MPLETTAAADGFIGQSELTARLEHLIVSGGLAVGEKLPSERELARDYGVSRPVVRESLRGLEERGYISIVANRGSFVRAITGRDLVEPLARVIRNAGVTPRNIVEARSALECAAAETAAWVAGGDDILAIRAALEKHSAASGTRDLVATDLEFHEAIVRATHNPVLSVMYTSIRPFVVGIMTRSQADRIVRDAGDPLHVEILRKIEARDTDGARDAMKRHITLALKLYGEDIDRYLEDVLKGRDDLSGIGLNG